MDLASYINEYFCTLDSALEKLSLRFEGKTSNLPPWALSTREVRIGITPDGEGVVLRVTPDNRLESDSCSVKAISLDDEVKEFCAPWGTNLKVDRISRESFVMLSDFTLFEVNNPLAEPVLKHPFLIGYGDIKGFANLHSKEKAKKDAIELWNQALSGAGKTGSFILESKATFERFRHLIRRKAYVERRIHRFIDSHANLLLPHFKRKFFEHEITSGEKSRKADFILEREEGFPPLLIELESPVHKVFTKKGDLTASVNHAKGQIAEWVDIIDTAPHLNATGEFSFLSGPKQRLVIIGRGLEHKEMLVSTKRSDTTIWTYELLLEEAKKRWNNQIAEQCKIIGMKEVRPF